MLTLRPAVLVLIPFAISLLSACSDATFSGAGQANANDSKPNPAATAPAPTGSADVAAAPSPASAATPAPAAAPASSSSPSASPTCTANDSSTVTGARIAFLVDNSGSNGATDCPSPTSGGTSNGTDTLSLCGAQTERENAVLASFDLLVQSAANQTENALATSQVAIASFPTVANEWTGWAAQTAGWVNVATANRASVAKSMLFARQPRGVTPFAAAMTAATSFFAGVPNDGRANVAVLLSDGEATDSNPAAVEAQAAALTKAGVQVFVMIYGGSLAANATSDSAEMQALDTANVKAGNGHWYASTYASLSAYLAALVGVNGQGGLATTIASTPQNVIQLQSASALTSAIQSLIKTKALQVCTAQ